MTGALAGRTILVTRPADQAREVSEAIEAEGGCAVQFPLIEIIPVTQPAAFLPLASGLREFALVFFVSPNAVAHGLAGLRQVAPWPSGLEVAAVGAGTRRALEAAGFATVIAPESGFDSEAVLELPAFSAEVLRGRRVLIVRGDGGRELVGETLHARGARVEYLCCYHRRCPEADPAPLLALARGDRLDAISLTSSVGIENFARIVGTGGLDHFAEIPGFVSHPRIAERLRHYGMRRGVLTGIGDEALIRAMFTFFG